MSEGAFLIFQKVDNRASRAKTDKEIVLGADHTIN